MWKFLGRVLASIIGTFIGLFVFIIIMFGIIAAAIVGLSESDASQLELSDASILKISFNKEIVEYSDSEPLNIKGFSSSKISMVHVIDAIDKATTDPNIKGISIEMSGFEAGYASAREIREAILLFKQKSKKPVYAYGEFATQKAYYLASAADKVFLNPAGLIQFNGISHEVVFLKGLFDKLGIEPEIYKCGTHKSAIEPLVRTDMSKESKEQASSYIESIYQTVVHEIATSRKIEKNRLRQISDSLLVRCPGDAKKYNLVDDTLYYDQVLTTWKKKLSLDENPSFVSVNKYLELKTETDEENSDSPKIAVIIADGEINSGKNDEGSIGSDETAKLIREAREDEDVKAIVIRINSPGGSAMASDVMWREVELASKAKPVIASMSDMAASGGYYLAMAANKIVAQPNTLTGSIGIFGVLVNLQPFLKEKLGVTTDRVSTGPYASIESMTRPRSAMEKKIIQTEIERLYQDFTQKAAKGRHIAHSTMLSLAEGKVYSGVQARELGLVDELGNLKTAIRLAAKMAKITDYTLDYTPKDKGWLHNLGMDASGLISEWQQKNTYGIFTSQIRAIEQLNSFQGPQARIPFDIVLE